MADWNNNNLAHLHTWFGLRSLNQTEEPFPSAGTAKMSELTYWSEISGAELRRTQAGALAVQLKDYYVNIAGAEYETDYNEQSTVAELRDILLIADKTISDLSAVADKCLKFPWEQPE